MTQIKMNKRQSLLLSELIDIGYLGASYTLKLPGLCLAMLQNALTRLLLNIAAA